MKLFYEFIVIYILMFLVDYLILKKLKILDEYSLIKKLSHIKVRKNASKKILLITSFINSLILTLVCMFAIHIQLSLIIVMPLSFLLLLLLIYSLYSIYGNILRSKYEKKKRKK